MRFPWRAIAAGLLAGTVFFFFPFLLRFIFIALLIGFIVRLVSGGRWRGFGWGRRYYDRSAYGRGFSDESEEDIVPIDGQRYASRISGKGPAQAFTVH